MNSIWNNNISLFKVRFPGLYDLLKKQIDFFNENIGSKNESELLYPFWTMITSKTNEPIAIEQNLKLHSVYNPNREAESLVTTTVNDREKDEYVSTLVFLGFGLGYAPIYAARTFSDKSILLVEPNIAHFLASLIFVDFAPLFLHKKLVIAVSCPPEQLITLINQNEIEHTAFFSVNSQMLHEKDYFDVVKTLIERNKEKEKINQATLKKFKKRWICNCNKNIDIAKKLDGVNILKDKAKDFPFVLIGAGPSLQSILPYLKELKEKAVLVCVDTALRACLRSNVEPDFIVLTDPQYWAYRHIGGLQTKKSILITELAVYNAVFKFKCKKKLLCDSQIPFAKDFDIGQKGDLGSGGSVASSAFNFCVLCGAKEIYVCGLDFAFPNNQTHIKGSSFEEKVHTNSQRILPAEKASLPLLFGGSAFISEDYNKNPLLTDKKMKMFAWWFESRVEELKGKVLVYTFCPQGLKIPGIKTFDVQDFLKNEGKKNKDFFNIF